MLKMYSCNICKTKFDQISHHKSHIETQKHKDKKELVELKLSKLTLEELHATYFTTTIYDISQEMETVVNKKLITNDDIKTVKMAEVISNKEALKDKIHEIHNFIRNHGGGYGMSALKVFNILYGLKKIEENNLVGKCKLSEVCRFSHLLGLANKHEDERLTELIIGEVLDSIRQSDCDYILFYEIPRNIPAHVFSYLIKEIDKITQIEKACNVLLSGKIYEYFIGRDESAISELGAYFTDRHIVDFILDKLNPCLEDGNVPTMVDMFGGSGGFTTGYINYLKEKNEAIDWETQLKKVSHFDMNEDVIKSAGLEFFCLTGVFPDKANLHYKNSFTSDFEDKKYKYPLTNPPYGGDKSKKSDTQEKRDKVKEYIKNEVSDASTKEKRKVQLKEIERQEKVEKKESDKTKVTVDSCSHRIQKFAKVHKLKGNDKESCSLMLLMDIVEVGGTAIGVLKEGVFFNKTYKDVRKCLIENYNVREVISVPSDQFENTSTKTSIVIFDNIDEKTSEVRFSDLIVDRYTEDKFEEINGYITLVENKGDIIGVHDEMISVASRQELLTSPIHSLNGKDYNKKVIVVGKEYELVKLGDICKFLPKSKRPASFGKKGGGYNFYTSSNTIQKCDIADYNEECLIIGAGGVANIKIDNRFSCSGDNHIINTKYNNYLYSLLNGNIDMLADGFKGSTLKHLSKEYLIHLQIPIPKSPLKMKEWVDKISVSYYEKNEKQRQIKELELFVQEKIGGLSEYDEVELGSVCEYIKTGKNKTPDNKEGTLYPYYGTADITGYTNHYLFDGKHILVARNGTMGNCFLVEGKIYPSDHIFVLKNNSEIKILLLYYIIKGVSSEIKNSSNGSIIKGISKENLSKIKIKIPKNKQFIDELEETFQQIETLQQEVKMADNLYNQYIQELSQEAMPTVNEVIEPEVEIVVETPKPKKRKVKSS
jgi:type I restriction-modification system DNA methylase subunit/restriction endonuclease S subunit